MVGPLWLSLYQRLKKAQKRSAVYSGLTGVGGQFSVSFGSPYPAIPHVEPQILPSSNPNHSVRVTTVDVNGFTVVAEQRATLTVLSLNVLASAPTPLVGAPVSVFVMEA